jgi:hypothetical protein
LLVWAPVAATAAGAFWLRAIYWENWTPASTPWPTLWLAATLWWATVLLLLGYAGLALWRPNRAPHDRLSGVYLVPR